MSKKIERNFEHNNENVIEFITGDEFMTVTFTQRKYITKIKKLYKSNSTDFDNFYENTDGSICARIPLRWLKINLPRKVSDEQRAAASERFKKMYEESSV